MARRIFNEFEKIPILAAVGFSLVFFTPCVGLNLDFRPALWVHIISFLCLGVIFEIPAVCLNVSSLFLISGRRDWKGRAEGIRQNFGWQYWVTHYAGPLFGIMTVASGIYLIHAGGHSFNQGWLFWIMTAAVFGLYEGIFHHNVFVKKIINFIHERPLDEQRLEKLRLIMTDRFDQALIFSEPFTFSFIFVTAYVKPAWFINPLACVTGRLEHSLGSAALLGLVILACGVFLIPLFRKNQKVADQ